MNIANRLFLREYQARTIMRPVSRSGLNLPREIGSGDNGTDRVGILNCSIQLYPKSRRALRVYILFGCFRILTNNQIHSPILIDIRHSARSLFPVDINPTFPCIRGLKFAAARSY